MTKLILSYEEIRLLLHSLNLTKKNIFQYKLDNLDKLKDIQLLEDKIDNLINTINQQTDDTTN